VSDNVTGGTSDGGTIRVNCPTHPDGPEKYHTDGRCGERLAEALAAYDALERQRIVDRADRIAASFWE
jgi:hypothetical protein